MASPELLRALVDRLPAMVAYWDAELRCQFANAAYQAWFGVSGDAMIGRDMAEFLGPLWALNQPYVEGALRGEAQRFDRTIPDPHGGPPRHSEAQYLPDRDPVTGAVRGFCVLVTDVTARELREQELVQARDAAEAANRELETFSYSVAHDLRAPLRCIDGYSQALLEDCGPRLTDDERDQLGRMRKAAQHMAQLIDDLLQLAHLGRVALAPRHVDLTAIAQRAIARLRRTEPGRAVEVVIADGLAGHGDARLLTLALACLVDNAWKFTRATPAARIEIGAERGAYYVRDNGVGFDMAFAGKLFGVFQRLHTATELEGTGVGLATVARIVARHAGRIWAEDEVGRGATFWFTLGAPDR
jgi:PAS domain S-box-containing protein